MESSARAAVGPTLARRPPAIVYACVPIGAVAFAFFRRWGLVADTSYWVVVGILLVTGVLNLVAFVWLSRAPDRRLRLHVRLAVAALSTAVVLGSVGWGSLLIIGYAVGLAAIVQQAGAQSWRFGVAWCGVAIVVGEIAVGAGVAPSLVDVGLANAVALCGFGCLLIVARVLGATAEAAEVAEEALRARSEHFEALIEHAVDVIAVLNRTGTIVFVSPAVVALLGFTPAELEGSSIATVLQTSDLGRVRSVLRQVVDERGAVVNAEVTLMCRNGARRLVEVTITHPETRDAGGVVMNIHDVTIQRQLEERLRSDALHDALTGLWNRSAFIEQADAALMRAARDGSTLAVLFVDLNGFKQVNDTFGHDFGDEVLADVADRLRRCLRASELLARFGGDEFTVLVQNVVDEQAVVAIADRICHTLHGDGGEQGFMLGASIGIVLDAGGTVPVTELLRRADEAMYSAKRSERAWELAPPAAELPDTAEGVERGEAASR